MQDYSVLLTWEFAVITSTMLLRLLVLTRAHRVEVVSSCPITIYSYPKAA